MTTWYQTTYLRQLPKDPEHICDLTTSNFSATPDHNIQTPKCETVSEISGVLNFQLHPKDYNDGRHQPQLTKRKHERWMCFPKSVDYWARRSGRQLLASAFFSFRVASPTI